MAHFPLFTYELISQLSLDQIHSTLDILTHHFSFFKEINSFSYTTPFDFVHLPYDQTHIAHSESLANKIRSGKTDVMVVIGIGGSHLGAYAIYNALASTIASEKHIPLLFVDSIDPFYVQSVYEQVHYSISQGKKIALMVVSKSGTTLETILNFQLFFELIKKAYPSFYSEQIIIITEAHSLLWNYAHSQHYHCIDIPGAISGRYSVFSAVGLLPLSIAGIDIDQLCQGARAATNFQSSSLACIKAALTYQWYKNNLLCHTMFVFAQQLVPLAYWWRQLVSESLGKDHVGIIPLVATASADLHSMIQLYLAGPRIHATTFLSVEKTPYDFSAPSFPYPLSINFYPLSFAQVHYVQLRAIAQIYAQYAIPHTFLQLPECSAFQLGFLMQTLMIEAMSVGKLLEINPFDQPQVQEYKTITDQLLHNK